MEGLIIASFIAGLLTILAPCVVTLIPVIVTGSIQSVNKWRPLIIALSLGVSVFVFTLLLKASTLLIDIPFRTWQVISGGLLIVLSLTMLFPDTWSKIAFKLGLFKSEKVIGANQDKADVKSAVVLGAALGPVFSSCSPTYLYILATVLPMNLAMGVVNLLSYTIGMVILLLIIGYGGQAIIKKLKWAANPKGWFKTILGIIVLVVGILIVTGLDKTIEAALLDTGYVGPINIEQNLMENFQ